MEAGVYKAYKKDGSLYYRASITFKNKHISLGSFTSEALANAAYLEAKELISASIDLLDYNEAANVLDFKKWVCLINFRDNGLYFKTPIYLKRRYFEYYLDYNTILKFDVDDLFFYSTHSIMKRGGHYFVSDYGMQINIQNRYGIKNYAVLDKDYRFVNGDSTDFRYVNIEIINHYNGVSKITKNGITHFLAKIHINGDFIIGRYATENEAGTAYNKAIDILYSKGISISYQKNYIDGLNSSKYKELYNSVSISKKLRDYNP